MFFTPHIFRYGCGPIRPVNSWDLSVPRCPFPSRGSYSRLAHRICAVPSGLLGPASAVRCLCARPDAGVCPADRFGCAVEFSQPGRSWTWEQWHRVAPCRWMAVRSSLHLGCGWVRGTGWDGAVLSSRLWLCDCLCSWRCLPSENGDDSAVEVTRWGLFLMREVPFFRTFVGDLCRVGSAFRIGRTNRVLSLSIRSFSWMDLFINSTRFA